VILFVWLLNDLCHDIDLVFIDIINILYYVIRYSGIFSAIILPISKCLQYGYVIVIDLVVRILVVMLYIFNF